MQIRSGRTLCGVDAAALRSFLLNHPDDFTPDQFGRETRTIPVVATQALKDLEAEGYVRTLDGGETFLPAEKGEAVMRAHPGGPYKKSFLRERMLELAGRVARSCERASVNLYYPAKFAVYGSYLTPGLRTLGDLDLAVEFRYVFDGESDEARRERVLRRASELGRYFLPDEQERAERFLKEVCAAYLKGNADWLDLEDYETVLAWEPEAMMVLGDVDDISAKGVQYDEMLDNVRGEHEARYGSTA